MKIEFLKELSKLGIICLALLAAFTLGSCTKEVETEVIRDTGSITTVVGSGYTQSKTKVKRGQIHAWVKDVTIVATSNETDNVASRTFTLIDAGEPDHSNAADFFKLNKVALGSNDVTASSTTDVVGVREVKSQSHSSITDSKWRNDNEGNYPYAVYSTDAPVRANVAKGQSETIRLNMNTQNARLIATLRMKGVTHSEYVSRNFTTTTTVTVKNDNGGWDQIGAVVEIDVDNYLSVYISDENSIGGTIVNFAVEVKKADGTVISSDLDATVTLRNSTSYKCNLIYNVKTDELFNDVKTELIWQDWVNTGCDGFGGC